MFDYVTVWFILLGGSGYRAPLDVRSPECNLVGEVIGVTFDRDVNPQTLFWPDPYRAGHHCHVAIGAYVAGLEPGEYHVATTEMYRTLAPGEVPVRANGIDPHTTEAWRRSIGGDSPGKPSTFRVVKP